MAGSIRQPIPLPSLSSYLSTQLPRCTLPITIKQFTNGQSNPTYLLTSHTSQHYVLRKMPPGPLLSPTAHQIQREYRILHALQDTDVPVPKTFLLCEDEGVIGTAFYVMEYLDGRIFKEPGMEGVKEGERSEMWHDAIRTLAKLHSVNVSHVGLEDFGKPAGFYDRQIKTFGTITKAQAATRDVDTGEAVGEIQHVEEMLRFFGAKRTQPRERATLIHGDFKIDNLVFHKTEPKVIGILDWEMSTRGHSLSDLVNLLMPYHFKDHRQLDNLPQFSEEPTPGLPSQQQLIRWYTEETGWDPSPDLDWGNAFGMFRTTCIFQGIAARYALRQASSALAKEIGKQRLPMAELTWKYVQIARESTADKARL